MADESSRLLNNSADFRNAALAKNGDGYTSGNEYNAGHADTISDGDDKGRDPEDATLADSPIGTKTDISVRGVALAKNADKYTKDRQYGFGNGTV